LQGVQDKFPQFEEIHILVDDLTTELAEAKRDLSETVSSVRKMDNDLFSSKNKIDISLSSIERCSEKVRVP
jgi:hypothetical protein